MTHTFKAAPGRPDGIELGRFARRGDVPFGKSFHYTDSYDLTGEFSRPDLDKGDGTYPGVRTRLPWYKRLFKRKRPVAWAEAECGPLPQAYMLCDQDGPLREVNISDVRTRALVPVYTDDAILAADHYMNEHPDED